MTAPEASYKSLPAHEKLVQWGAWLREGNRINIGRLTSMGMGRVPGGIYHEDNEDIALDVQDVWTKLVARSRNKRYARFVQETYLLYAFVLKLEYQEAGWTREEMVQHVSRKLKKTKYNRWSLLNHLGSAVLYVEMALKK